MEQLTNLILQASGEYGPTLLNSAITVIVGIFIYKIFHHGMDRLSKNGIAPTQLTSTLKIIFRWLTIIIVVMLIFGYFGVSMTSFWAALSGVLVLVAIGFVAVWSVLSNILCSILLVVFSPFRIGDEIEIQDPTAPITMRGKVIGINMFFTTVESTQEEEEANNRVITRVPNNQFFQRYVRVLPGTGTQSLKSYLAEEHQRVDE
ncbi:MAG: mechanosensitive ion channel [Gammaproteobacteria bacterium]|nr:mechanosensitive ion channel [Gammaproteobacteria bacterium]